MFGITSILASWYASILLTCVPNSVLNVVLVGAEVHSVSLTGRDTLIGPVRRRLFVYVGS